MYRQGWMYLILVLLVIGSAELLASVAAPSMAEAGFLYDPATVRQSYSDYLSKRDLALGWRPTPAPYDANRQANTAVDGTRADPDFPASLPPCASIFGDSYTWADGLGVRDSDAWGAILSKKLGCRVANYGVMGYGSDQAYLRFRLEKPQGKVVLLNHLSENILRNVNQWRHLLYQSHEFSFKPRFIVRDGQLELIPTPDIAASQVEQFLDDPGEYLKHEYFLPGGDSGIQRARWPYALTVARSVLDNNRFLARIVQKPWYTDYYSATHSSGGLSVTFAIFDGFVRDAQSRGQIPVVSIIPTCGDLKYAQATGHLPYVELSNLIRARGFRFIDFGEKFLERLKSASPEPLYVSCKDHFNREGYRVLADIAYSYLTGIPEISDALQPPVQVVK